MLDVAEHFFVYGTLMPGEARWALLRPFATGWQSASTPGHLWDTGCGYPAARFFQGGPAIPGFLVAIDPARLCDAVPFLDEIEAEGVLYRRRSVMTTGGHAMSYEWLGSTEGLALLATGWPLNDSPGTLGVRPRGET
jgi:gamma-glutamylcyclotransferase (GGCT)/AIG2-like uncharacterized protein YtfP